MNTQKNAYEIRLQILLLANNNAWQEYAKRFEHFQTVEMFDNANIQAGKAYEQAAPYLPTPEIIKKYAAELYKFVEQT